MRQWVKYLLEKKLLDIIVSDLDGVLVDISDRIREASLKVWGKVVDIKPKDLLKVREKLDIDTRARWDFWFNKPEFVELDRIIPDRLDFLKKLANRTKLNVIIVSGRTEDTHKKNLELLEKINSVVPIYDFYFWDMDEPIEKFKVRVASKYNPCYLLEDSDDIIDAFKARWPDIVVYRF